MKYLIVAAICCLQLPCLTSSAAGPVSSYTTLAAYQAAAPPQIFLLDFSANSGTTDGRGFNPLIDFDSPEAVNPDLVLNSGSILRDTGSTIAPNNVGPIGGRFSIPVSGIAFDLSLVEGTAQTVRLFDSAAAFIGEATTPVGNGFFGVVSATPFVSFIIQNGVFSSGIGNDRYFLDNFRANAVPEPSTVILGIAALVAFGRRRVRKRPAIQVSNSEFTPLTPGPTAFLQPCEKVKPQGQEPHGHRGALPC